MTTPENFDLTPSLAPYLEPQLLIPILQHLAAHSDAYPKDQVLAQLLSIVTNNTTRADLAISIADQIQDAGADRPSTDEFEAYASDINSKLDNPDDLIIRLRDFIANNDDQLRSTNRNGASALVQERCNVTSAEIDALFDFAKAHYSAGNFDLAFDLLTQYRLIAPNYDHSLPMAWGRLAASLLSENQQLTSLQVINRVRDSIDNSNLPSPSHVLEQRIWQLHWSLFIVFRIDGGMERCFDLLFKPEYLNAIETASPWLLRYVVAACSLTGHKNTRDIARHASQDRIRINDPLCRVYEHLFNQVDLEAAGLHLGHVTNLCAADYFLAPHMEALMYALRKQLMAIMSKVYVQLFLDTVLAYLHLENSDLLAELAAELPNGAKLEFGSIDGRDTVMFTQQAQSRRNVHEKVDKLTHQSDNTMAELFKKMH